jgi:hypothetical protein
LRRYHLFDGGVFSGIQTISKSKYGTTQIWIYVDNPLRVALWAELDDLTPIFLARWQAVRAGDRHVR